MWNDKWWIWAEQWKHKKTVILAGSVARHSFLHHMALCILGQFGELFFMHFVEAINAKGNERDLLEFCHSPCILNRDNISLMSRNFLFFPYSRLESISGHGNLFHDFVPLIFDPETHHTHAKCWLINRQITRQRHFGTSSTVREGPRKR